MVEIETLEGPVPVIAYIDERLSTTAVCLASAYGARHDPAPECGLAHVLEHVLMSAPVDTVPSFSEHVERLGGHANAETGPDRMLFYAQTHPDDAEEISALLYQAVLQPRLNGETLAREKRAVLQELAAAAADPSDVVQDDFLTDLYPGHPLGRPVGGTVATVERMDEVSVAAGHTERLLSAPLTAVVVGPRMPATIDALKAGVGPDVLARSGSASQEPVPLPEPGPVLAPRWPSEFAWVCAGARSVPYAHPHRPRFSVLAQLLGSSPSSLLYRRLRGDAGLAYAFQAWNRGYADTGAWRLLAGVEPGNGDAALAVIRGTLEQLASDGPTSEDLASARRQAQMNIMTSVDSPLECARFLAMRADRHGTWSPSVALESVRAVESHHIRQAAAHVLEGFRVVVSPRAS
ncbi:pitrilysin family protein [Streptomyces sp. NPDC020125]|uniref:M16 family metallopeptidase n=1 Tax=Streptomyces sp. NPDC020125 TaxID=3154593 RepID=UPI003410F7DA